ncbi:ankyrin repeat domain-containing protein [Skeletonema marinoi]|uniref:Ankyrin repeat domain-containing protein n=1 Tax=Skeletonema marinoi TaxID=267567 RepID=A0AAD8XVD1_9STRA|nr:ankyrin repeat domain-containing protein [Skeletonema marinoi]
MPLHCLCENIHIDDAASLAILKLLILKCPEAIRHANNDGELPIHLVGGWKSPEFCRLLIEAYPGSERITNAGGALPFYCACSYNTRATVEYLYKLYPDAINHTSRGFYPIHYAITGVKQRVHPIAALEVVKYLLDCDPNVKLQKIRGKSLLHYACRKRYNDSNIDAALEIIEAIYDTHPEAIEENRIASDIQRYHQQVQTFINSQLVYSRQAKDRHVMTTPDDNGRLPLHTALQNNVRLGSIKLLVKGNPHSLQTPDNSGTLTLHMACQHHNSANVIQYLVGLDATTLDAVDREGNTALHYACHYARHEIIALLLDKFDAVSVSKRNSQNKLPIDLLWESSAVEVEDKDSVEYTESVFRLLAAYPETLMNIGIQKPLSAFNNACPGQSGRKRKFGEE